jgi:hypothetical protein
MGYPAPMQRQLVDKSVGVAFVLTFFFGPLGMLYTDVVPAIIMIVIALAVGLFTLGIGLPIVWLVSIIWACVSASNKHSQFQAWLVQSHGGYGLMASGQPPWGAFPTPGPHQAPPMLQSGTGPGWYVDPYNPSQYRWWDGSRWTGHQRPAYPSPPEPPVLPPPVP